VVDRADRVEDSGERLLVTAVRRGREHFRPAFPDPAYGGVQPGPVAPDKHHPCAA
jgi:hypothetical protein